MLRICISRGTWLANISTKATAAKNIDLALFFGPEKIEKIGGAPLQGTFILPRVESKSRPYQIALSRAVFSGHGEALERWWGARC